MANANLGTATLRARLDAGNLRTQLNTTRGEVEQSFGRMDRSIDQTNRRVGSFDQSLGRLVTRAAALAGSLWAARGAVRGINALATGAERADNAVYSFNRQIQRSGVDSGQAAAMVERLANRFGVLPETVQEATTLMLRNGAALEDVERAMTAAGASAAAVGFDISRAFDNVSTAVSTGRSELLEAVGVVANLGPVTQDYASSIGKTVDELTEAEVVQARVNAIYAESEAEIEDVDKLLSGLAGTNARTNATWTETRNLLGDAIQPAVIGVSRTFGTLLERINPVIDRLAVDDVNLVSAIQQANDTANSTEGITNLNDRLDTLAESLSGRVKESFEEARGEIWSLVTDAQDASAALARVELGTSLSRRMASGLFTGGAGEALNQAGAQVYGDRAIPNADEEVMGMLRMGRLEDAFAVVNRAVAVLSEPASGNLADPTPMQSASIENLREFRDLLGDAIGMLNAGTDMVAGGAGSGRAGTGGGGGGGAGAGQGAPAGTESDPVVVTVRSAGGRWSTPPGEQYAAFLEEQAARQGPRRGVLGFATGGATDGSVDANELRVNRLTLERQATQDAIVGFAGGRATDRSVTGADLAGRQRELGQDFLLDYLKWEPPGTGSQYGELGYQQDRQGAVLTQLERSMDQPATDLSTSAEELATSALMLRQSAQDEAIFGQLRGFDPSLVTGSQYGETGYQTGMTPGQIAFNTGAGSLSRDLGRRAGRGDGGLGEARQIIQQQDAAADRFAGQVVDSAFAFGDALVGAIEHGDIGRAFQGLFSAGAGIASSANLGSIPFLGGSIGIGSLVAGGLGLLGSVFGLLGGGGDDAAAAQRAEAQRRSRNVPAIELNFSMTQHNRYEGGPQMPQVEQAFRRQAAIVVDEFMTRTRIPERLAALEGGAA